MKFTYDDAAGVELSGIPLGSGDAREVALGIGYNLISINIPGEDSINLNIHRAQNPEVLYREDCRPRYHFSSAAEWINDPNGLCYDRHTGLYHMFYQTRPRTSSKEPNQCWYHAVSHDLITWEQWEPALVPDSLGYCWSGSANIDRENTSGLFSDNTPPDSRIVLAFSSVYSDTYYGTEKISLAYTNDGGRTFVNFPGNPIIRNGENHVQKYNDGFRDPKLLRFDGKWLMLVGGGQGRIFSSDNLRDWKFESAITDTDGTPLHGECPDFFPIKVEGTDEVKWVYMRGRLDLDARPMIFQTIPAVGNLMKNSDGGYEFRVEQETGQVMHGGNVMYATQSFADAPDGRWIEISWDREWLAVTGADLSDRQVKDWNGLMSLPLEIKLFRDDGKYFFTCEPTEEVKRLRDKLIFDSRALDGAVTGYKYCELEAEIIAHTGEFGFNIRSGNGKGIRIICSDYDSNAGTIKVTVDARVSGRFGGDIAGVVCNTKDGRFGLRIFTDENITDVFCSDKIHSVFALSYPDAENTEISCFGDTQTERIRIYSLKDIH